MLADGGSPSCSPSDPRCSCSGRCHHTQARSGSAGTRRPTSSAPCSSPRLRSSPTGKPSTPRPSADNPSRRRVLVFQPRRIDWWASAVQLVGTLYFNVSTGAAMHRRLGGAGRRPIRVATRRRRFPLLPRGQCTGLVRGLPSVDRLAPAVMVLVDHLAQPARLDCLRRLGRRQLRHPGDRRAAGCRAGEPGHARRRGVLSHRRAIATTGTDRGNRPRRRTRRRTPRETMTESRERVCPLPRAMSGCGRRHHHHRHADGGHAVHAGDGHADDHRREDRVDDRPPQGVRDRMRDLRPRIADHRPGPTTVGRTRTPDKDERPAQRPGRS